jgi:hypothetical protein
MIETILIVAGLFIGVAHIASWALVCVALHLAAKDRT